MTVDQAGTGTQSWDVVEMSVQGSKSVIKLMCHGVPQSLWMWLVYSPDSNAEWGQWFRHVHGCGCVDGLVAHGAVAGGAPELRERRGRPNVARDKVADIYGVRGEILFHSDKHMDRKRELPHYSLYRKRPKRAPKSVIYI